MMSSVNTAVRAGVLTLIRPEPAPLGARAVTVVVVAAVVPVTLRLKYGRLLLGETASNFVPVIVMDVPATAEVGVKLVIVGAPIPAVTVNGPSLASDPFGLVTEIVPVAAPEGTETTSVVVDAELIDADVPVNETVF